MLLLPTPLLTPPDAGSGCWDFFFRSPVFFLFWCSAGGPARLPPSCSGVCSSSSHASPLSGCPPWPAPLPRAQVSPALPLCTAVARFVTSARDARRTHTGRARVTHAAASLPPASSPPLPPLSGGRLFQDGPPRRTSGRTPLGSRVLGRGGGGEHRRGRRPRGKTKAGVAARPAPSAMGGSAAPPGEYQELLPHCLVPRRGSAAPGSRRFVSGAAGYVHGWCWGGFHARGSAAPGGAAGSGAAPRGQTPGGVRVPQGGALRFKGEMADQRSGATPQLLTPSLEVDGFRVRSLRGRRRRQSGSPRGHLAGLRRAYVLARLGASWGQNPVLPAPGCSSCPPP